jgi:hypothetical protein
VGHAFNRRRLGGWGLRALEALRPMGVVFVAFDRDRRLDTGTIAGRDVGLAEVAGIGQELFRPVDLLGQSLQLLEHRRELLLVVGRLRYLRDQDQLRTARSRPIFGVA